MEMRGRLAGPGEHCPTKFHTRNHWRSGTSRSPPPALSQANDAVLLTTHTEGQGKKITAGDS